jgi:hypothetical protein
MPHRKVRVLEGIESGMRSGRHIRSEPTSEWHMLQHHIASRADQHGSLDSYSMHKIDAL